MLRVLFGVVLGVYIGQNYQVPDVLTVIDEIRATLSTLEKRPPKK